MEKFDLSTNLKIERIAVAIICIMFGLLSSMIGIWGIITWLEFYLEHVKNIEKTEIIRIIFRLFILLLLPGFLSLFGGITLYLNKRPGWILGVSMSFYKILVSGILVFKYYSDSTIRKSNVLSDTNSLIIGLIFIGLILLILNMVYFLHPKTTNHFRIKKKQILVASGLILFFVMFGFLS